MYFIKEGGMGLIKSENTGSEPRKPSILEKIQELKHMCMAKGRTPIILLMNKQHYAEIEQLLNNLRRFPVSGPAINEATTAVVSTLLAVEELLDLEVVINDKVTDFMLVDDRHWYEQTF